MLKDQPLKACTTLGLQIDVGFVLVLEEGRYELHTIARIQGLGASNGMLLVRSFDEVRTVSDQLIQAGYGYSVFDDAGVEGDFDIDSFKEMFQEWGWFGDARSKPAWMS